MTNAAGPGISARSQCSLLFLAAAIAIHPIALS